ncbi:MAG: hypothetical protein COB15_09305, partial [Flavobacteriales bacterium]
MKRFFLFTLIVLTFISNQLIAQNLIPNPSFEAQDSCPTVRFHGLTLVKDWTSPTNGTPDYFHSCGDWYYQTPKNTYDTKDPYQGNAYIGIANNDNYREYTMSQLSSPLKKGRTYKVTMFASTSNNSDYTSSGIGLYFTNNSYFDRTGSKFIEVNPQIENTKNQIIPSENWIKISGEFIAQGNEQFLIIGYFKEKMNFINISGKKPKLKHTYIFIDNVSTVLIKRPKLQLPPKGKTKILKTIYFEHNKYILNKESNQELTELTELLKDSNHVNIEILGHTDISGDEEHNITLSKQRAKAVVNYLVK